MRRATTRGFRECRKSDSEQAMNQLHNEPERRFIDLAGELADDFATRAARHDEEGSFPFENYERLKSSGYTRLTIPESLGGLGATMLERIKAQERLAQGCGATALAINMHFNTVGLLIDVHRKFKAPNVEQKLRRIAAEQLICGGSGSEPDNAIVALRPRTMAQPVDGGWLVNGRKIFGTQSVAMDLFFAEAICEDGPRGPTILTFFISPRNSFLLTPLPHWSQIFSTNEYCVELTERAPRYRCENLDRAGYDQLSVGMLICEVPGPSGRHICRAHPGWFRR